MNIQTTVSVEPRRLVKQVPSLPALIVTEIINISIRGGTVFAGTAFAEDFPVAMPEGGLEDGADYAVIATDGIPRAARLDGPPSGDAILGGFHFAPGGNAIARSGGDTIPAINPYSVWDLNSRPACPDPRGMTRVDTPDGSFWCDIYLTGVDHLAHGTSRFGATIADGDNLPGNPAGGIFRRFDYEAACAVMAHHDKCLLSITEFFAAAFGVTEKSARGEDPCTARLDAPRTSRWGLMQATGNMWIWGHDGDPDIPRPSFFGGSWVDGSSAGSRCAYLVRWPGDSDGSLGARGRSDHLQLGRPPRQRRR